MPRADEVSPYSKASWNASRKRTKKIADAWEEQKAIKEVMLFLQTVEVSTSIAVRIYKKYGDASIGVVKNQPYRLASDVWGIGFLTADRIAQSVGIGGRAAAYSA